MDFLLAEAAARGGESQVISALHSDDVVELGLRRLSSQIYLDRTGDSSWADRISGLALPGAGVDAAPTWLVEESTIHSKMEHQRTDE